MCSIMHNSIWIFNLTNQVDYIKQNISHGVKKDQRGNLSQRLRETE